MDITLFDFLLIIFACFAFFFFTVCVPLGYYLEFKGRYYREKWFELENKRREEHPEQFKSLSYRIYDFIKFGKK